MMRRREVNRGRGDRVDVCSGELKRILDPSDVRERFGQQGADATYLPPDAFVAFMKAEWAKRAA